MTKFKITPTEGNVIVKGVKPLEKTCGIILQVSTTPTSEYYEIVAGKGTGNIVVICRYQGQPLVVDEEDYIIVREEHILAVVNG